VLIGGTLLVGVEGWLRPASGPASGSPMSVVPIVEAVLVFGVYGLLAWPRRRRATYRRVCAAAFFARGLDLRLDHLAVFGFFGLAFNRHLGRKSPGKRLRDAHR
jgi:hypothetical protein